MNSEEPEYFYEYMWMMLEQESQDMHVLRACESIIIRCLKWEILYHGSGAATLSSMMQTQLDSVKWCLVLVLSLDVHAAFESLMFGSVRVFRCGVGFHIYICLQVYQVRVRPG